MQLTYQPVINFLKIFNDAIIEIYFKFFTVYPFVTFCYDYQPLSRIIFQFSFIFESINRRKSLN